MHMKLKMNDEKLIKEVRRHECLYDFNDPKYWDANKKRIAWREVAKRIKQPIPVCKQRWQELRDVHRKGIVNKKAKAAEIMDTMKKWRFDDEMAFLQPFVDNPAPRRPHPFLYEEISDDAGDDPPPPPPLPPDPTKDPIRIEPDINPNNNNEGGLRIVTEPVSNSLTINCNNCPKEPPAPVIHLVDERPKEKTVDDLDTFFMNISSTVKKFTAYQQAIAKHKIFSVVSEMELEQLAPPVNVLTAPVTSACSHNHASYDLLNTYTSMPTVSMPTISTMPTIPTMAPVSTMPTTEHRFDGCLLSLIE